MARFYGRMQGNRQEVTRMGDKTSGFEAHVGGWNIGVKVVCSIDDNGKDCIEVYETGGSSDPERTYWIASLEED